MMCMSVRARKIVFASALPVLILSLCVFQPLSARAAKISEDSQGLVDPSSPERSGYALTASEEFNGNDINHQLFMSDYLPHWSRSAGTRARYQVSGGSLKLIRIRNRGTRLLMGTRKSRRYKPTIGITFTGGRTIRMLHATPNLSEDTFKNMDISRCAPKRPRAGESTPHGG